MTGGRVRGGFNQYGFTVSILMPEELTDVIVFLRTVRAGYVTGRNVAVDGGLTRGVL
jgi:NAD(P)-dependent dehydrogenase (short-subunit alcohol dehydrogenase family)